ncbi:uncharacterized protein LOC128720922 [Anopheles nili]|uniref:uncharacterized protein LOC128720922 n=1 Tax=Anopheles nili TaxID=185578 RepID=UPI00237BF49B|nr:uncharacterized protein LOC128720922 [Anopheles nili]
MVPSSVALVAVLLPLAVLSAPTVHLQDGVHISSASGESSDNDRSVTEPGTIMKPHIVEPTWITVTMPPLAYNQPVGSINQPHVMPPYVGYFAVPPQYQPPVANSWPSYYPAPNMVVLPPYPGNHLCNQPASSYRVI